MKLSKRALSGLKGSIKKWEKIAISKGIDEGIKNCTLCKLYWETGCMSCPVFKKTKSTGCEKTPYIEWIKHHKCQHKLSACFVSTEIISDCIECKEYAELEVEFLKSLLPE